VVPVFVESWRVFHDSRGHLGFIGNGAGEDSLSEWRVGYDGNVVFSSSGD
jgi:hypothetical protein